MGRWLPAPATTWCTVGIFLFSQQGMTGVVLPTPGEPREWIVCLFLGVVIVFSMFILLRPLQPRGRTRVMDVSATELPVGSEAARPPPVLGGPRTDMSLGRAIATNDARRASEDVD